MRLVVRLFASVIGVSLCLPLVAQSSNPPGGQQTDRDKPAPNASGIAKPDASKLPGVKVDVKARQVRVECQAINANMPLEFFCVMSGTAEHESVLRTDAKPSHVHLGLLMLGLEPGEPVKYSEAAMKWIPPQGPPLHITCEWQGKDGKTVRVPAYRMMRNVKSKRPMPALTWVFCGSRMLEGNYAADTTGYVVSVVNFDLTLIDIPELASNDNETLEWEFNPDVCPQKGTKVWMILEAAGKEVKEKAQADAEENPVFALAGANEQPGEPALAGGNANNNKPARLSDVQIDEQRVKNLRQKWEKAVKPHNDALREAAQAHYEVVNALRAEQNRLIDEADRIQRVIDQLQKDYQDMTTPRPEGAGNAQQSGDRE